MIRLHPSHVRVRHTLRRIIRHKKWLGAVLLASSGLYMLSLGWLPPVPYGADDPAFFSSGGPQDLPPSQVEIMMLQDMEPRFPGAGLLVSSLWSTILLCATLIAGGDSLIKARRGWSAVAASGATIIAIMVACFTLYLGGDPLTALDHAFYINARNPIMEAVFVFPSLAPFIIGLAFGFFYKISYRAIEVTPVIKTTAEKVSNIAREISGMNFDSLDADTQKAVSSYVIALKAVAPLLKGGALREREIEHTSVLMRKILLRVSAREPFTLDADFIKYIGDLLDRARSDIDAHRAYAAVSDQNELVLDMTALKSQIELRA